MNKDRLSRWAKNQSSKYGSRRKFAMALQLLDNTVRRWELKEVNTLSDVSILAIATYEGKSVNDIRKWLGLPSHISPLDKLEGRVKVIEGTPQNITHLENRVSTLEKKIDELAAV